MFLRSPFRLAAVAAALSVAAVVPAADAPLAAPERVLTDLRAVRQLTEAEARHQHPVRVRAIVIGLQAYDGAGYFVMDDTDGIFVAVDPSARQKADALQLGHLVDIEGVSDPGNYAPQIRERKRTVVGEAALPPPRRLNYEQIASGEEDCQRAEIEGIVRSVTRNGLLLAMGDGRVDVTFARHDPAETSGLVDARVRLRGVVCGRFNQKRQWISARFAVSGLDGITVLQPPPPDPFAAPAHAIHELLRWELNQLGRHRLKVRGVATHFQPGVALFIREGSPGLQIRTSETQPLAAGDVVEVLGFPALGTYSAVMQDAVFRRVGREPAPEPFPVAPEQLMRGEFDAGLVSLRAVLLESVRQQGARVLVMQAGEIIFQAVLGTDGQAAPELPAAGSLLNLTGICVIAETAVDRVWLRPRMFSLLLRSPADIRVLEQPSWWTARRLWQALGIISLVVFGSLSWAWLLRRQVRAQTAALKEQMQREAILDERTRIAQELHDTLDQELTGISLQLNAAVSQLKTDPVGPRLEVVQRLLHRSQSEVRRSVWDLRQPAVESGGIATALEHAATQHRNGSTAAVEIVVQGEARPLPALVEHHLRRIGAEAMTNAFRHARASRVVVHLRYEPGVVVLRVQDNGCGFVADQAPGHTAGHFGLIGMRERCRKIGGAFRLESAPANGTCVEIRVPAPHQNGHAPSEPKPAGVESHDR